MSLCDIIISRMYCYTSLEFYDADNGIRGGGGLGVLAADMRRIAERMGLPLVVLTPFYPEVTHQKYINSEIVDERKKVHYADFGFRKIGNVLITCNDEECHFDAILKEFDKTKIVAITEPNFGVLYQDESGSEHRLYQEVALGFAGLKALKLAGISTSIIQMNEVVTAFLPLAALDELVMSGVEFDDALVIVRERTIYTNHTLVQAAEANFTLQQFERYVFPNIKSDAVREWARGLFRDGGIRLSDLALELAAKRNGVSKLHARVAKYVDIHGDEVKFTAITNGIDLEKWVLPETLKKYRELGVVDDKMRLTSGYAKALDRFTANDIRALKQRGREVMNEILRSYPNHRGQVLKFGADEKVIVFKRRFVDYKRPEMPFTDAKRLRTALEPYGAHYIIAGRVHAGDAVMSEKLRQILATAEGDDYLREHVHYLADYDERLAYGLSVGCNVAVNVPIVGLEACGTSWMKDVANLNFLISTIDGGVADVQSKYYFPVHGDSFEAELDSLYFWLANALKCWGDDSNLDLRIGMQLYGMLPVISGERMLVQYLDFVRTV